MHIMCQGNAGGPTVILEAGQGNASSMWAWVQPEVAKTARVCVYDRAGIAWSDDSPEPRDAEHMAGELHTLLANANIAGPYVLVAHSFGGLVARVFASQYPQEVAGVVLVDSMHPDQWTRDPESKSLFSQIEQMGRMGNAIAPLGLLRMFNFFPRESNLPAEAADAFKAWVDSTRFMRSNTAELNAQPESWAQASRVKTLGAVPLVVLTASDHGYAPERAAKLEKIWQDLQNELAGLSTNHIHRVLPNTTHGSLLAKQTDAQAVIAAVRDVVNAAQSGKPMEDQ
jgi:pimeloyl-ACP methyl ester carboxylesterase